MARGEFESRGSVMRLCLAIGTAMQAKQVAAKDAWNPVHQRRACLAREKKQLVSGQCLVIVEADE